MDSSLIMLKFPTAVSEGNSDTVLTEEDGTELELGGIFDELDDCRDCELATLVRLEFVLCDATAGSEAMEGTEVAALLEAEIAALLKTEVAGLLDFEGGVTVVVEG